MNELKNLVNELTENHPKQMIDRIDNILQEFKLEYLEARITHKGLHSYHEGYAVLKEEIEELWDEIKKRSPVNDKLFKEAIQVGAMALAFIHELLETPLLNEENK
ncbi:MAG: hypothetical protein HeimC2_10700 [Candidatus Heimdallarchaeota archaeon LC_2]|nr:MAG: hypothetical protein HeimC2_10700 [Candidatus Heimdallarchaeota archaeon LC_2]